MKELISLVVGVAAVIICFSVVPDAWGYFSIQRGDYATPWYSTSWFEQPFTNAMLFWRSSREEWKPNAIGTEMWQIREIDVGNKTYWTVLQRRPIIKG